jgi:uncharacterized iron-regulated membrane protein
MCTTAMVRKFLFTLHLLLALIAGVFIVILGLTGSVIAFEPELDHLFHPKLWYVQPRQRSLSLEEITAAMSKHFPGEAVSGFTVSTSPDLSYQVTLKRGTAYVNQYTGEVLGVRTGGRDFLATLHQLHLRLAWQSRLDPGKAIMSWTGVIILFLTVSGLYLWWPLKRMTIRRSSSGWKFWFDVHNAIGMFSIVFLCLLTFTGVMIGFDETTVPLLYSITGSKPSNPPKIPKPTAGATPIAPDRAMEIANTALPGASAFGVNIPGPDGSYLIRSRYPEDRTPGGRSRVLIDQYSGNVLFVEGSRTAPAGTRMVILNRAIHTGDIFGIPSKALASIISLALVAQLASGVMIWLKRR